MKLREIGALLGCEVIGDPDVEAVGISHDSRGVEKGFIFAALEGQHTDGARFIAQAAQKGAVAVLAGRPVKGVNLPQIIVADINGALSRVSDAVFGEPSRSLIMAGVTGTNGKTTTTYILESIIRQAGFNPGVIGTVNYRFNGKVSEAPHTTPQAPDLHRILKEMASSSVTHCVMEVSSHALEQKRVADCRFNVGVFTNLTHDHLDYHETMEEYFRCKSILFRQLKDSHGISVVNIDDHWGLLLKKEFPASVTFSLREGADVYPREASLLEGRTEAVVKTPSGIVKVSSHLVGEYNLQNILGAVAAAHTLGIECQVIAEGINGVTRVPGRLEKIESSGRRKFRAYIDYAHTGDALERALEALKKVAKGRIITVFGCGGNRDRLKRPVMGEISARLSTVSIITSDNPRDEDPLEIIKEVEAGIEGVRKFNPGEEPEGRGYAVIPDRKEAIRKAVKLARDGDTILIAGKGHEDYQIVKGQKYHFNDFEAVAESMAEFCGREGSAKGAQVKPQRHA